jgi:hypothetical protein
VNSSRGQDLKSEVHLVPELKEYHEGDIVELDLKIWPIENADLDEFKKIEGTSLYSALEIEQVNSVANSENNADVVEIKATAIITNFPDITQSFINYKNTKIKILSPEYKIISIQEKKEDFYILDQSSIGNKKNIALILSIVAIAIALFFIIKKVMRPKDPKFEIRKSFQNIFNNANERKDFENIYASRSDWVIYALAETQHHKDFFRSMELHQYKKEWSSEELTEIKNSFEHIKRSFL